MNPFTYRELNWPKDRILVRDFPLRDCDRVELETHSGGSARDALFDSVSSGDGKTLIGFCYGVPYTICGNYPHGDGTASIWGVGTDLITEGGRGMIMSGRELVEALWENHSLLWNYVDMRNEVHKRYLRFLGAVFPGRATMYSGMPFEYFEIRRS